MQAHPPPRGLRDQLNSVQNNPTLKSGGLSNGDSPHKRLHVDIPESDYASLSTGTSCDSGPMPGRRGSWRHPPLRRAGHAGAGRITGPRLVHRPPRGPQILDRASATPTRTGIMSADGGSRRAQKHTLFVATQSGQIPPQPQFNHAIHLECGRNFRRGPLRLACDDHRHPG